MAGEQLRRLTSLRWFAALAVFTHHVLYLSTGRESTLGAAGVSFFFVLSGVVLAWSARLGDTACGFWRRRFARIYPATFVSGLIAAVLVATGLPQMRGGVQGAWSSLLLIQSWMPGAAYPTDSYNAVTWSLSCEAFFYALFPLLLVVANRLPTRWLAALAAGFALAVYLADPLLPVRAWGAHLPIARLPEFVAGVVIGVALRRGWVPRASLALAAPMYAVALAVLGPPAYSWLLLLPFAVLLLCAAAGADRRGCDGWLTSRPLVYLGEVSFCFYLTHQMALRLAHEWLTGPAWIVGGFTLALGSAAALHHWVELPAQCWITRGRSARSGDRQRRDRVLARRVETGVTG